MLFGGNLVVGMEEMLIFRKRRKSLEVQSMLALCTPKAKDSGRIDENIQLEPQLQEEAPEQPQSPFILMVGVVVGGKKVSDLLC